MARETSTAGYASPSIRGLSADASRAGGHPEPGRALEASRLREQYPASKATEETEGSAMQDRVIDLTTVEDATEDLGHRSTAHRPDRDQLRFRRYRLIGFALALIDILCLTTALLAAHALRFDSLPGRDYTIGMVVAAALWVGVFHAFGLYAPQHLPRVEEVRRTISAVGVGIVVVILLTFWLDVYLSRSWMAYTLIIALVLELSARGIARLSIDHRQTSRSLKQRTLVIGTGERAAELMAELDVPGSGYLALGYIDAESPLISSATMSPAERVERLRTVFHGYDLDCVFVASPTIGVGQMVAVTQGRTTGRDRRARLHPPLGHPRVPPHRAARGEVGRGAHAEADAALPGSAGRQAGDGPRPGRRRTDRRLARPARGCPRHQGHVSRTRAVPPGSGHRRGPDVQDVQVPHDDRRLGSSHGAGPDRQVGRLLQAEERSSSDEGRHAAS